MFRLTLCAWLLALSLPVAFASTQNRIWLDAKINNQPVKLIFDTGCDTAILFRPTAERLGLEITEPPANAQALPGQVLTGHSNLCELKLWKQTIKTRFNIVDLPPIAQSDVEGMIGWPPFRPNIIEFDANNRRMSVLPRLPVHTASWQKFPIRKNANVLVLEVPRPGGGMGSVMIDTGSSETVSLSPRLWKKWKEEHPAAPVTLTAYYMPGAGMIVSEVMWAPKIMLGTLELQNVLIKEANITEITGGGPQFMANLPMAALARKDLIVDGKEGFAYLSPKYNRPKTPVYNRLGAVFAPSDLASGDLQATVAPNSPAERAGIQNGDILVKIGSRDVSNWRSQPAPKGKPSTELPEGTKLPLVLKRNGEIYKTTAVLEDILRPSDEKPKALQKVMRWIREHKPQP